jgi:hypothetical protein
VLSTRYNARVGHVLLAIVIVTDPRISLVVVRAHAPFVVRALRLESQKQLPAQWGVWLRVRWVRPVTGE